MLLVRLHNCALTLNNDVPGLDGDLDPLGDVEQFLRVAVAQLSAKFIAVCGCAVVRDLEASDGRRAGDISWNAALRESYSDGRRTCTSSWRLLRVSDCRQRLFANLGVLQRDCVRPSELEQANQDPCR
jgi:hypothetical protein